MGFSIYPPPKKIKTSSAILNCDNRRYLKLSEQFSNRFLNAIRRFVSTYTQHSLTQDPVFRSSTPGQQDLSSQSNGNEDTIYVAPAPDNVAPGNVAPGNVAPGNVTPGKVAPGNLRAVDLCITYAATDPDSTLITLQLSRQKMAEEAYQLSTSSAGYLVTAHSETGLFRGLASLEQILAQQDGLGLPYIKIEDEPDFPHRGVMLDVSRCKVPTLCTLKKLIDTFARLKYNQLQLYTEHTFAFTQHPHIWSDASPYDAADMLEIQSYCLARFIDLVPNLNCFGHFERWLQHPEYQQYAECPNGFIHPLTNIPVPHGSTLKPDRKSLQLINDLHAEYLPLFASDYFNVGGDEPWELGQGRSKLHCAKKGTTNVYINFMAKIKKLVRKRNRTMMFWSDIVLQQPASLKLLSRDMIALNWGYEAYHPFKKECQQLATAKIPFYVCPGTSSWNALTGRLKNARLNLANAARNGLRYGAQGYLVTDWGDHGHHQYLPISYPGFALGACHSWNHQGSRAISLTELMNRFFIREPEPVIANLLARLGQVPELAPTKIKNATIFNQLLFWDMQVEPKTTAEISDATLRTCLIEFDHIRSDLQQHYVVLKQRAKLLAATAANKATIKSGKEQLLILQELENAIAMARHGIHRLQFIRHKQTQTKQRPPTKKQLKQELKTIIKQHNQLWLARNRLGGLAESINHLNKAQARSG
ncbi:MAG: family 20 glycosylhydrolase [Pseudomonadales bacterium]|nr:family 20 glycosylhydrolase [Pseudomonadales bacterium]